MDPCYLSAWYGWVYVAFVIDAYARRIIGWRTGTTMTTSLLLDAIEHAICDRGTQYTASATAAACTRHGLLHSAGSTGICWDNAGAESLWSSFKHECYYRHTFATKTELIDTIDNWMQFFNHQRRHSAIGMLSLIDYEQSLNAAPEAS
ncbi:integrase core domain-containing protein [Nocardia sp. NPDC004260]